MLSPNCIFRRVLINRERNLKIKNVTPEVIEFINQKNLQYNFKGEIECDLPNKNLYTFQGKLQFGSFHKFYVKIDQFLWRVI